MFVCPVANECLIPSVKRGWYNRYRFSSNSFAPVRLQKVVVKFLHGGASPSEYCFCPFRMAGDVTFECEKKRSTDLRVVECNVAFSGKFEQSPVGLSIAFRNVGVITLIGQPL